MGIGPLLEQLVVGGVIPNSPADKAGIQEEDVIVSLNGREFIESDEAVDFIKSQGAGAIEAVVSRSGKTLNFTLHAKKPLKPADANPILGIALSSSPFHDKRIVHPGPLAQVSDSLRMMWTTLAGLVTPSSSIGVDHLSGPVGIAKMQYKLLQMEDGWRRILAFMVLFNVNLAVLNMLPFPVLDGGHITLALLEKFSGPPGQGQAAGDPANHLRADAHLADAVCHQQGHRRRLRPRVRQKEQGGLPGKLSRENLARRLLFGVTQTHGIVRGYDPGEFYDEMFGVDGTVRDHCAPLLSRLASIEQKDFLARKASSELYFLRQGITFNVYHDDRGTERIFPFDPVPRVMAAAEWEHLEAGLSQRIVALNLFLHDIYHDQRILQDEVIPRFYVEQARHYRPEFRGVDVPGDIYIHICGSDLIRGADGQYYVLEDNGRCPSGASYLLENRNALKRAFPRLFEEMGVRPVDSYPRDLLNMLHHISPRRMRTRSACCSRPVATTAPISNTVISPARWASTSSRAATSWWWTRWFSCAPPAV